MWPLLDDPCEWVEDLPCPPDEIFIQETLPVAKTEPRILQNYETVHIPCPGLITQISAPTYSVSTALLSHGGTGHDSMISEVSPGLFLRYKMYVPAQI